MAQPAETPAPPSPERRPTVLSAHGEERVDDWYWLRDRDDPAVLAHLEAENAYTRAVTAHLAELEETLYAEMVARIQETDLSVPVRKGPWMYYRRTEEGKQYALHCRSPYPGDGGEEILLDENAAAEGASYFAVGGLATSPDHRLLAYAIDTTGAERHTLRVRDIASGRDLDAAIENTYYGLAWSRDASTVFYTRPDGAMRPHQLWRHRIGTPVAGDVCVYQEDDERFYVSVGQTKDEALVVLTLESKVTTEIRILDSLTPLGEFVVVEPRRQGIEYSVEHHGDELLIVTNDGAENFRLAVAPASSPGADGWRDLVPHSEDVKLDGIEVFDGHVALFERAEGSPRLRVLKLADGSAHEVRQPEAVSTTWPGANLEPSSTMLRFEYTSLITPRSVYDYDMESRSRVLLKRQPVLGSFDPKRYRTEREWAKSSDGTMVPISLVHDKDVSRDGSAPALLYGYGSYEHSVDPAFSSLRLSLLERGFVFAIAHVRGGGEMGRPWYNDGKLLHKPHTFTDFVACARHLIGTGWTSPDRLVARGASAGGLLIGAVANTAPEVFCAMVAEVPFVDCLTTILDDGLPLTVLEWEEWGNPRDDPDIYACMRSYSPYDNVGTARYPALMVTAGLNDPRVSYWEPAKWVAKLRAANRDNQVLLRTEMGAGHQGPSGRYEAWRDEARITAFVIDAVSEARGTSPERADP